MRKNLRRKDKRKRNLTIIASISLICFLVCGYAAFSTNLSITAKGNVKEKSRVIQSWDINSQTDFHSDFYKENIVSATFLDNSDVPSNATESWNVSEDKTHGGVMAYVIPNNEDNTKYDLYIGAKDGIIANADSKRLFSMFKNLTKIDFNNNFDTSNTVNMSYMFFHCESLISLDLTSFDTSNVTDMHCTFDGCVSIENLNISSFNTSNVTTMQQMFYACDKLISLDLSNFDTKNVTNMYYMFYYCYTLETLNLCSFDISNVTNMGSMFKSTSGLKNIYVNSNWNTDGIDTTEMFLNSGTSSVTFGMCG